VHNSPLSSEANLRWRNRSHIARRTDKGSSRGEERFPRANAAHELPANAERSPSRRFAFSGLFAGFASSPPFPGFSPFWERSLGVGREPPRSVLEPEILWKNSPFLWLPPLWSYQPGPSRTPGRSSNLLRVPQPALGSPMMQRSVRPGSRVLRSHRHARASRGGLRASDRHAVGNLHLGVLRVV
jgi:hypothetical protein